MECNPIYNLYLIILRSVQISSFEIRLEYFYYILATHDYGHGGGLVTVWESKMQIYQKLNIRFLNYDFFQPMKETFLIL